MRNDLFGDSKAVSRRGRLPSAIAAAKTARGHAARRCSSSSWHWTHRQCPHRCCHLRGITRTFTPRVRVTPRVIECSDNTRDRM